MESNQFDIYLGFKYSLVVVMQKQTLEIVKLE